MIWNCGTELIREDEIKTFMPFPRAKTRNLSDAQRYYGGADSTLDLDNLHQQRQFKPRNGD